MKRIFLSALLAGATTFAGFTAFASIDNQDTKDNIEIIETTGTGGGVLDPIKPSSEKTWLEELLEKVKFW